jgi:Condensation domain.
MEKLKLLPIQKAIMCFSEPRIYSPSLAGVFMIEGKLDKKKLETVIDDIVHTNDAFSYRFTYDENDDEIYQYKVEGTSYTLDERTASGDTEEDKLQDIRDQIAEVRRIDIEGSFKGEVPWNIIVFDMGEDKYILYVRLFHLITDGMSIGILINKIISGYNGAPAAESANMSDYLKDSFDYLGSSEYEELLEKNDDLIKSHMEYKPFLNAPRSGDRNFAKYGDFITLKKDKLAEICRKNRLSYFHVALLMAHTMFSIVFDRNETRLTIPMGPRKKKYMATIGPLIDCYFSRIKLDDDKTMLENTIECRNFNLRETKMAPIMSHVITEHDMPMECIVTYQSYISNFGEQMPFGEAKARAFADNGMMDYYYSNCLSLSGVETNDEIILTLRNDGVLMNSEQVAEGVKVFEAVYKCLTEQDMTFAELKKQFIK